MHYHSLVDSTFLNFWKEEEREQKKEEKKDNFMLTKEEKIEKLTELFQEYSMHESLWCYRRSLLFVRGKTRGEREEEGEKRRGEREEEGEKECERVLEREIQFCCRWLPSVACLLRGGKEGGKGEEEGKEGGKEGKEGGKEGGEGGFEVQAAITRLGNPARHALVHLFYCLLFFSPSSSDFYEKILCCLLEEEGTRTPNFGVMTSYFQNQNKNKSK